MDTPSGPIRVLLVDDSPIVLHILQRLLSRSPGIVVAGTASNGREALDLLPELRPDVICTDLHMPVMDGLAFTRAVMERQPRPILVVSVSVEAGSTNVFNLLEAGAVDVFPKPSAIQAADMDRLAAELASRIRILAGVHVMRRANHVQAMATAPKGLRPAAPPRMVVIGASTGGPQALQQILSHLPEDFPLPLVCVQHIGATFLSELVAWLDDACCLSVRVAIQGELPRGGVVYFAPSERHLAFNQDGRFWLQPGPLCDGHCPSVTITLRAAAQHFGAAAVGVLLTGMGRDGADGIAAISRAGGMTIAQDEASSVVYGMPKEAVNLGVVRHQLPLIEIAPALMVLTNAK